MDFDLDNFQGITVPSFNSPFDRRLSKDEQLFIHAVEADEKSAKELSRREIDLLVTLVAEGHNSYQDFCKEIQSLTDSTFRQYVSDVPADEDLYKDLAMNPTHNIYDRGRYILGFAQRPERYTLLYQFSPEDTFELTPEGESILYTLKKERFSQRAILASVGFAAASFFATIISWFIG